MYFSYKADDTLNVDPIKRSQDIFPLATVK